MVGQMTFKVSVVFCEGRLKLDNQIVKCKL